GLPRPDHRQVPALLRHQADPSVRRWGLIIGGVGLVLALWLSIQKLFFGAELANRPALLAAVLMILVGGQFITMGLLAELQARTYYEAQRKPIYAVRRITRSRASAPPAGAGPQRPV
ncbi:MAG: hypothetical protein AB7Y46_18195, partial [Armatimonadota bacterium]